MPTTGTQLIQDLLAGKPTERVGVAGWVHMPMVDHNVTDMVRATISVTDYCGWDFIKVMSTGHYIPEAFGGDITISVDPHSWAGHINRYPIQNLEDLRSFPILDMTNPILQREVAIASGIKKHYGDSKPVIATIFNPITCLQEMMSRGTNDKIIPLMEEHPADVHDALRRLVAFNKNYLDALIQTAHIDGIFLANQYMSRNVISDAQFDEFVTPYDQELLAYIKGRTWFNVLHVHGENNLMFDKADQFDVQALSWENCAPGVPEETISSVRQVRAISNKLLITGLARHYDYYSATNDRAALKELFRRRLRTVIDESGDQRVVFAPGCALPLDVDRYVFTLMKEVVEEECNGRKDK